MIAVIADDFTGAAEIGGVGLKRGLNVVIETEVSRVKNTDLLVIVTDTRSLEVQQAKEKTKLVTSRLMQLKPQFIYKKIDSVLRGNVYEELVSQQHVEGKKRIVVVPANPYFKRIIKDGIYYIDGVPLGETSFSNDPEFPITSSNVSQIIGGGIKPVRCLNTSDLLPATGFIVGNVSTISDSLLWADNIDDETIYAGGSGFFETILEKQHLKKESSIGFSEKKAENSLFIFGSMFPKALNLIEKMEVAGMTFINLSEEYFNTKHKELSQSREETAKDVALCLDMGRKVVITTVFKDLPVVEITPDRVRKEISLVVKRVFDLIQIRELYIEGGATAFQILRKLGITKLKPVRELAYGIIEMEVDNYQGLNVITKPGSYQWPDSIFRSDIAKFKV